MSVGYSIFRCFIDTHLTLHVTFTDSKARFVLSIKYISLGMIFNKTMSPTLNSALSRSQIGEGTFISDS